MVWNSFKEVMILGRGLREECDQNACWEGESLCQVTERWVQVESAGVGGDRQGLEARWNLHQGTAWRLGRSLQEQL